MNAVATVVFRLTTLLTIILWAVFSTARADETLAPPGPRDTCPVCGMLVSKYPNWTAAVKYRDGHTHYFDGAKDLFKFLQAMNKYASEHSKHEIASVLVTEFYGLKKVDAYHAWFVVGSDVLGPMGHEFVPLESKADATEFLKDHKGRQVLSFGQVTPEVVEKVDEGKF